MAKPETGASGKADCLVLLLAALPVIILYFPGLTGQGTLVPTEYPYQFAPLRSFAAELGVPPPQNELFADLLLENYVWKSFARAELGQGRLPLWNPFTFGGTPFLAGYQPAVLYPPGVIFWVLPLHLAYSWFDALHQWLAIVFTFLFLRRLGLGRPAALFGGLAYGLSAFMVVSAIWPMVLSVAAWLPALLWAIAGWADRVVGGGLGLHWLAAGTVAAAMILYGGHPEVAFYSFVTAGAFGLYRLTAALATGPGRFRRLGLAAAGPLGMVIFGTLLAAPQLGPFLELAGQNFRTGLTSYEEVIGWAYPPRHLLAYVVPDIFGNPTARTYLDPWRLEVRPFEDPRDAAGNPRPYPFWGTKNYVEGAVYVGLATLVLAAVGLAAGRPRGAAFFWGGFALGCLALAFGSPLYRLVWLIPGADQLHTPFRWSFPAGLALAVLGAFGLEVVGVGKGRAGGLRQRLGGGLAAGGLVAGLILIGAIFGLGGQVRAAAEGILASSAALRNAFGSPEAFVGYEAVQLARALGFIMLTGLVLWLRPALVPAVLAADLLVFGLGYVRFSDPRWLEFVPPAVQRLQAEPGPFRIASFGAEDILPPNLAQVYGLEDIRGYDSVIPARFVRLWELMEPPQGLLYNRLHKLVDPQSLDSPILDLLNVRFVLTARPVDRPGWQPVYSGEVYIYENPGALPRAFLVYRVEAVSDPAAARDRLRAPGFNPAALAVVETPPGEVPAVGPVPGRPPTLSVVDRQPGRWLFEVETDTPAFLVISEAYFPGWSAAVDGQPARVFPVNVALKGLPVPAGRHRVEVVYRPVSFRASLYLAGLGAAGLLILTAVTGLWRLRRAEGGAAVRVVRNSLFPIAAQLFNRTVDLGFAVLMARFLGPEPVGRYAFAVTVFGYFSTFVEFGLNALLTRNVARDRRLAPLETGVNLGVRLAFSAASVVLVFGLLLAYGAAFGGLTADTFWATVLLILGLGPGSLSAVLSSLFYAHERAEYPALLAVFTTLVKVGLGVPVLLMGGGIVGLAAVSVSTNLVTAAAFFAAYRQALGPVVAAFDPAYARQLLGQAWPLFLNNLLNGLFFRVDVVLLKGIAGDLQTGYYNVAYKFIDGAQVIPAFFTLAAFPVVSRLAAADPDRAPAAVSRGLRALFMVGVGLALFGAIFAEELVVLLLGEEFRPAGTALALLVLHMPPGFLNSFLHYVLIAYNRQRAVTWCFAAAAAFNIAANGLLIPYWGYRAAALNTVLTELVLLVPFWVLTAQHIRLSVAAVTARVLAAAAPAAGLMVLARTISPPLAFGLGLILYPAGLVITGGLSREDLALLRRIGRSLIGRDRP